MVKQNGGVFLDDATSLYSGLCLHLQYRGKMLSDEAAYSPRPVDHANSTKKSPPLNPEPLCTSTSCFWRSFSGESNDLPRSMTMGKEDAAEQTKSLSSKEHWASRVLGVLMWSLDHSTAGETFYPLLYYTTAFEEEGILCSALQAWEVAEIIKKCRGTCSL